MNKETEILQAIAEHLGLSVEDLDRHALLREALGDGLQTIAGNQLEPGQRRTKPFSGH